MCVCIHTNPFSIKLAIISIIVTPYIQNCQKVISVNCQKVISVEMITFKKSRGLGDRDYT